MTDQPVTARSPKVGKLRPSQVVTQHGPGAIVDLPELSVIVAGINHWRPTGEDRVPEPRLERFLKKRAFFRPPQPGPAKFGGLPSFIFPEWLVCPRCRMLAPYKMFSFKSWWSGAEFRCPRQHPSHGKSSPVAFPARFMLACARGHLDDFPWWSWVHPGAAPCTGPLELIDTGSSGAASDLLVKCTRCDASKALGDAFKPGAHDRCSGRRPWLSPRDTETCGEKPRTILRGASNAYFSIVASALSIPPWSDPIHQDLAPYQDVLSQADDFAKFKAGVELGFYKLGDLPDRGYTLEQLWKAFRAEPEEEPDLRRKEWQAFRHPEVAPTKGTEFEIHDRSVPPAYSGVLERVVAATRLREVRALRGFTRIDSRTDLGEQTDIEDLDVRVAPVGLKEHDWLPGIDLRGEGIFIEIREETLQQWEARQEVQAEASALAERFATWHAQRGDEARSFLGARYVLLHTLSHVLIRQLSLDCGYSSSSLRERIYCASGPDAMSGLLIYTATSDSEGSLGGLVDQAVPDRLGPLLMDGLRSAAFCAQDPLCGLGEVGGFAHLNGAACHACLLLAETSCEHGNRLLDRSVLVRTLNERGLEFFRGV
jgi:hypothetical protein